MLQRKGLVLLGDERQRRISAHATRVRTFVVVIRTLMVLRERHRIDLLPMHKAHKGKLRTLQEIFYHHLAFAERFVAEHILQSRVRLFQGLRYHHALACRQTIVFQHGRQTPCTHICNGVLVAFKRPITCRGHMVFGHNLFGKLLAGLNLRRCLRVPEDRHARIAECVHHACRQRRLGTYHRQINGLLPCECHQCRHIRVLDSHTLRQRGNTRIAGCTIYLFHLRATREGMHNGMLTPTRTDYKNFLHKTKDKG